MIDQVLQEIKLAEEKALAIRTEAETFKAEKSRLQEETCAAIMSDAQKKAKEIRKEQKAAANLAAEELYNEAIEVAKQQAEELLSSVQPKTEELSAWLLEKVINGDC